MEGINQPNWRTIRVQPFYPGKLKELEELSRNLWWAWNDNAVELFKYITESVSNLDYIDPIAMLKNVSNKRFLELEKDPVFIEMFNDVLTSFKHYMSQPYDNTLPSIAYFSMEYGLATVLKIYSGGLGVLAGDYLKQACDSRYNLVAVGLFYRQGYFKQKIADNGDQDEIYESQRFMDTPAELVRDENGEAVTVAVEMSGRMVHVQIWRLRVGRIFLYLLDTDRNDNIDEDKAITYRLYGGDSENRLKQEMILGIGGVKALRYLGIDQDIYHLNEGHAAFAGIERIRNIIVHQHKSFNEAMELVRVSGLFTTHTPVPAGHDAFIEDLMMKYMGDYPNKLGITWEKFINLGKEIPGTKNEKFSMSVLAARTCQEINGVSMLHAEVSRNMIFSSLYRDYFPEELHIGYVTNGVHFPTWASKEWKEVLYDKNSDNIDFSKIYKISSEKIWEIRRIQKARLINFITQNFDKSIATRNENPKYIVKIRNVLKPEMLTIGFARRFATYKRGNLLFKDLDRLKKIVNNPDAPVRFVFSGKAHPNDEAGQDIIRQIVKVSKQEEFIGKILFLEDYNMYLAKQLVCGVDVWLNTPTRPLEASGTSGMKAVMNGVLNFSVLDGWWVEGYKEGAGWALAKEKTYKNQEMQDELDAEQIYQTFENEIIPLFYKRNEKGIPEDWIDYIKKSIAEIAPDFTTERMINDYRDRYYLILDKRTKNYKEDNAKLAKQLASWKKKIRDEWNKIELISADTHELTGNLLVPGQSYSAKIVLNINGLNLEDIGVEFVISQSNENGELIVTDVIEAQAEKSEGKIAYFNIDFSPSKPGSLNYAFRVYPKPFVDVHRQDCPIVKWL